VRQAADRGASLVALPELFNCLAQPEEIVAQAEPIPGPTSRAMSELAAECQITLVAGSIAERCGDAKTYNTSLLFGPDGALLASYRKLHLFDIDLPGVVTFRESQHMARGDRVAVTDSPVGRLGQAICYDLRFPELFRRLTDLGAQLLVIPSAFAMATGRDHWEVLLRARAIENQAFVVAPDQYGHHCENVHTYGRSMIVDPWGTVLAQAADGEALITAEVDFDQLRQIRQRLPCLTHRRNIAALGPSYNTRFTPPSGTVS
jgi:predicted amidohydrolase